MPEAATTLLSRLQSDAAAAVRAREDSARAEAERIRQHALDEAAHRRAAALTRHGGIADREDASAADEATQRTWRDLLLARADALDRIFIAAESALDACATHPAVPDRLAEQLALALRYVPEGEAIVRAPASVIEVVRKAVANTGRDGLTIVVDDTVGLGLLVETTDHRLMVDATFSRALRRDRARLAVDIAREIEGDRAP